MPATADTTDQTATTARAGKRAPQTDKAARAAADRAARATRATAAATQTAPESEPAADGDGDGEPTVAQLIGDTIAPLIERRDALENEINARRAEVENELAPKVAQLAELNQFVRTIERKQGNGTTGGTRAPRGQNRDKILAVITSDARTTREISETTGIGRGSADRTLKQLEEAGEARKTADGWIAIPAVA